jgi:hypothetical protein
VRVQSGERRAESGERARAVLESTVAKPFHHRGTENTEKSTEKSTEKKSLSPLCLCSERLPEFAAHRSFTTETQRAQRESTEKISLCPLCLCGEWLPVIHRRPGGGLPAARCPLPTEAPEANP